MKEKNNVIRSIPFILAFFLLACLLPNIRYPFDGFYHLINDNGTNSVIYWLCFAIAYFLTFLIVANRLKMSPPSRYSALFILMVVYLLLLFFVHVTLGTLLYKEGGLVPLTFSWMEEGAYYSELLFDILFGFSFVFLWPYLKLDKTYQDVLPVIVVFVGILSAIYGYFAYFWEGLPFTEYPLFHSFFTDDAEYGKVIFVSFFSSLALAKTNRGWKQGVFVFLGVVFLGVMATSALALPFWISIFALLVFLFKFPRCERFLSTLSLRFVGAIFFSLLVTLILLMTIPSSLSGLLQCFLGEPVVIVVSARVVYWQSYFSALSNWNVFFGEGLFGYYHVIYFDVGTIIRVSFQSGILEIFNAGGIMAIVFSAVILYVGFLALQNEEKRDSVFKTLIFSFAVSFILYSFFADERLLFSSHFASFVAAYLFSCYSSTVPTEEEYAC